MSLLEDLLRKGYLPRELPPPFNSDSFATYSATAAGSWKKGEWTQCVSHNLARPGGLRRPLKIPHPGSYFSMAQILSDDWSQLQQHTQQVRLSASRPSLLKSSARGVAPRYDFGERPRLRALRRRGSRYLLLADISQCYPSIYTHAIPWALYTKAICKSALTKKTKTVQLLGDRIDGASRCMNDGQTHGIPIGPDSSFVIAEILLTAVDAELLKRCAGNICGFRYADDYELSFTNLRDAENALAELQGVLSTYELSLNPKKTQILELPLPLEDTWGSELGRYPVRSVVSPVGQRNDLLGFFSLAFELAARNRGESVLRYAVARLQNEDVHPAAWRTFQNCIVGAISAEPSTISAAVGTIYKVAKLGGHAVAKSPLAESFETLITSHARRGEGSEVAWALWGALAWKIPLSAEAALSVSKMEDDVVALLALDADENQLFPAGSLDKGSWDKIVNQPEALKGEHWLLTYESHQQGWLPSSAVASHAAFSAMSKAGVSFYDKTRNIPQFPSAAGRLPGGSLPDYYA